MISISQTFARCTAHNQKALIPFLTAGFPDDQTFLRLLEKVGRVGADMIEIGIPFSDPLADGPAIQYASQEALAQGMTVERTLRLLRTSNRRHQVPRIIMSYYNPIHAYGLSRFVEQARKVGISGLIIPDLIWEEGLEAERVCQKHHLDLIYLLARTSPPARRRQIIKRSSGFVYLVSVTGVTGARTQFPRQLRSWITQIKRESPLPVCVGFGISNHTQAREISRAADGIIIGSAIIDVIRQANGSRQAVTDTGTFLRRIREGMNHV